MRNWNFFVCDDWSVLVNVYRLPMRNWNTIPASSTIHTSFSVYRLPMRNWNSQIRGTSSGFTISFIDYLWGIEISWTILNHLELVKVYRLPMRNLNTSGLCPEKRVMEILWTTYRNLNCANPVCLVLIYAIKKRSKTKLIWTLSLVLFYTI